jgi:hypothetical protein
MRQPTTRNPAFQKEIEMHTRWIAVLIAFCLLTPPTRAAQPEGYRVTAYNGNTHQWTLIRNGTFAGGYQVKKLVVQCKWLVNTDLSRTYGPQACALQVGQFFGFKISLDPNAPLVNVDDLGDTLLITEGTLHRNTKQVFGIVSERLISPTGR